MRKCTVDACSAILVSSSDLFKHQRGTHLLHSALLVSGSYLLKQSGTHNLDTCSALLVSGSDLLKHWRETYKLNVCNSVFNPSCQWF